VEDGYAVAGNSSFAAHGVRSFRPAADKSGQFHYTRARAPRQTSPANLRYFVEFTSTGGLFFDHAAVAGEEEGLEFLRRHAVHVHILHGALRVHHGVARRLAELALRATHGLAVEIAQLPQLLLQALHRA